MKKNSKKKNKKTNKDQNKKAASKAAIISRHNLSNCGERPNTTALNLSLSGLEYNRNN